jgi:hypothetical protein
MPINYLQMTEQFPAFITAQHQDMQRRESLQSVARQILHHAALVPQQIDAILEREKSNSKLYSAGPAVENMEASYQAASPANDWLMIGVDGSQLTPDLHSALPFGLVNTGIFQMQNNGTQVPTQRTLSHLIYRHDENKNLQLPDEDRVNFLRDLEEREILIQLAAECPDPVIALTDGPLSLFHEPEQKDPDFERFEQLINQFGTLPSNQRIVAGYVDRPRSDLVVKMLELFLAQNASLVHEIGLPGSLLQGLRDNDLFIGTLPGGARTAVFQLHSQSARFYQNELALHFFYLNVGRADKPALVRIEIPAWVAGDANLLNTLHAQLLEQCQILGSKPYPYVLHRAHEIAIVHQEEKEGVESMLMKQWLDAGYPYLETSNKQFLKSLVTGHRRNE